MFWSIPNRKKNGEWINLPLFFLIGPTGSGKTGLSPQIFPPEKTVIINGDSQQVYHGLEIGTAQPPSSILEKIPHKLYGFIQPGNRLNAGEFSEKADQEISKCMKTKHSCPVIISGSGLYIQSILYGLDDLPQADPYLRKNLMLEISEHGSASLYDRLRKIDPEYAAVIAPADQVRIIRALEIWELSGKKLGELRKLPRIPRYPALILGLKMERSLLYQRINERTIQMLSSGWIQEVEKMLDLGFRDWLYNLPALGYMLIIDYLEKKLNLSELTELIQRDTRRLAKRQMTWFRKIPAIRWFEWDGHRIPDHIKETVQNSLS